MKSKNVEIQSERTDHGAAPHNNTPMKVLLLYRGLNARAFWQNLVEAQLKKLQSLASIACARVTLELRSEVGPPFRVKALLEVPGPDIHAEASDHTLAAALRKVVRNLERQIQARRTRLAQRRGLQGRVAVLPRLPAPVFAGARA